MAIPSFEDIEADLARLHERIETLKRFTPGNHTFCDLKQSVSTPPTLSWQTMFGRLLFAAFLFSTGLFLLPKLFLPNQDEIP
jgi:hypothetical protein